MFTRNQDTGATEKRQRGRRSIMPSDSVSAKHNKYNKRAVFIFPFSTGCETVFPMGYTPLEIKLRAITEFDHSVV
jgi:hypothetical protein